MNRQLPSTSICLVALLIGLAARSQASEPTPEITTAVEKSLPYLEKEGVAWMDKRGCVSCHQVPFMLWSLSAAQEHGFDVDNEKLHEWKSWSTDAVNFVKPEQKSDVDVPKTLAANIDTINAMLLAVDRESDDAWRTSFADALIENQKPDGSWQACGQLPLQKRPKDETTRVTVAWTLLALAKQGREAKDLNQAIAYLDQGEPAESTEWWIARLLLASEWGEDNVQTLRQQIIDRQHDDGGWGWLRDDPSDAMGTGMALYAIAVTADNSDQRENIRRAVEFLTSTQKPDGSWQVPGTKMATRKKSTPTADYWGTAWAVIGMLESSGR